MRFLVTCRKGGATFIGLVQSLLLEVAGLCRLIAVHAVDENTRPGTLELSEEWPLHRRTEILLIFAVIFSTETGSAQVGAGAPMVSRARPNLRVRHWRRARTSTVDHLAAAVRPAWSRTDSVSCIPTPQKKSRSYSSMVSGAGSRHWSQMVKTLEADASISESYQFLTFDYSTGDPIPYSAYLLRQAIGDLRGRLDPNTSNRAWNRMVLIGHSMGGLLCKMTTQDSGSKLWTLMTGSSFENLAGPEKARELLHGSLVFKPIPEVRRLIFIATPHRGSPLAWGPIKEIANRLVRLPTPLQQAHSSLLASNAPDTFTTTFRQGLATSIDELAWENPLLLAIDCLPIDPNVKRHSIVADLCSTVRPGGGDGQVPYASAHLPAQFPS